MARPRIVTDAERIEAAKAFTEGIRVRVVTSRYEGAFLQTGSTGTVRRPLEGSLPDTVIEVWMDKDPHPREDSWAWYPEELEVIQ